MTTRRNRALVPDPLIVKLRGRILRGIRAAKAVRRLTRHPHYAVATLLMDGPETGSAVDFTLSAAFTLDGKYLGDPKTARRLTETYRIPHPEYRTRRSTVCTIGFSPQRKKWFGWSYRAIAGFNLKSVVKAGDVIASRAFPPGYRPKTMADAKAMAKRFAAEVS